MEVQLEFHRVTAESLQMLAGAAQITYVRLRREGEGDDAGLYNVTIDRMTPASAYNLLAQVQAVEEAAKKEAISAAVPATPRKASKSRKRAGAAPQ